MKGDAGRQRHRRPATKTMIYLHKSGLLLNLAHVAEIKKVHIPAIPARPADNISAEPAGYAVFAYAPGANTDYRHGTGITRLHEFRGDGLDFLLCLRKAERMIEEIAGDVLAGVPVISLDRITKEIEKDNAAEAPVRGIVRSQPEPTTPTSPDHAPVPESAKRTPEKKHQFDHATDPFAEGL